MTSHTLQGKADGLPIADIVSGLGLQRALSRLQAIVPFK
jgi:hypothetical protein